MDRRIPASEMGSGWDIREGAWLQTFTGGKIYPLAKEMGDIRVEDIAHALSLQCRFAGHVRRFYSVAEHSVRVSYEVPESLAMDALFHDASEAYLVDIPRPIKPFLTGYAAAETRLMGAIASKFGFQWPLHSKVKWADDKLLAIEAHSLMAGDIGEWGLAYSSPISKEELILDPLTPLAAESLFLERFFEIGKRMALARAMPRTVA